MTESQITQEVIRYIDDIAYEYAILIDGEWGCGKTYYIKNSLIEKIEEHEEQKDNCRKVKYISLYGCKNIQDIQENIVWSVAEDAIKKLNVIGTSAKNKDAVSKITNNILLSSRKIGNAVLKKFVPEAETFSIASDWLVMRNYIFIFDDLERCDCPINEVFGLINGLVEHEGMKVILVANEKEISQKEYDGNEALEYLVALEKNIAWPKIENGRRSDFYPTLGNAVHIKELEHRRKWLFPKKDLDGSYKKIREKLIGVTLHYEPDIEQIFVLLVEKTSISDNNKVRILNEMEDLKSVMNYYGHHNLRTFQFFLSKVSYLLERLKEIEVQKEYEERIKTCIIDECITSSVKYKANVKLAKWEQEISIARANPKLKSIINYVEKGEFNIEEYKTDVNKYIGELSQTVSHDDPYSLLYNQYYYQSQKWCEEKIEEMLQLLEADTYPRCVYTKMIIILVRLVSYGFDENYLLRAKEAMINNTQNNSNLVRIDKDVFFLDDSEMKHRIQVIINEINQAISMNGNLERRKNINEILNGDNWVEELGTYIDSFENKFAPDMGIFRQADSDTWCQAFYKANSKEIDDFRRILIELHPRNVIRQGVEEDISVIKEIVDKLEPEREGDLIKRKSLEWLKNQFQEITMDYCLYD